MEIIDFEEEKQIEAIQRFQPNPKSHEVIPLVRRNLNTGWPLLQVSLYSPVVSDTSTTVLYEPALGGGKCHSINIGVFSFACLLSKIPGPMNTTLPRQKKVARDSLRLEKISTFLHGYTACHLTSGITISSRSNGYGYQVVVETAQGDSQLLSYHLTRLFQFGLKDDSITNFAETLVEFNYTQSQIESALNPERAIFSNGQIYIDFGKFLTEVVQAKELVEYFEEIFKVNQFRACMLGTTPEIQKLKQFIDKIRLFSDKLTEFEPKKAAMDLATELDAQLDSFLSICIKRTMTKGEFQIFAQNFTERLHKSDKIFQAYFASYRIMLTNIEIAVGGMSTLFTKGSLQSYGASSSLLFRKPATHESRMEPSQPSASAGVLHS